MRLLRLITIAAVLLLAVTAGPAGARSDRAHEAASCMGVDSSEWWNTPGPGTDRDFRSHRVKAFADELGLPPGFFHSSNARDC